MRWKSSDDEKQAWNRAKVFIGAAGCPLPFSNIHANTSMPKLMESIKINSNPWSCVNIYEMRWESSDGEEKSALIRAKVSVGAAGCPLPFSNIHAKKTMETHENIETSSQIHEDIQMTRSQMTRSQPGWREVSLESSPMRWKSSDDEKSAWNRSQVSIPAASCPYRFQKPMPKNNENQWES